MVSGANAVSTRNEVLTGAPQAVSTSTMIGGITYTQVNGSGTANGSSRPQARSPPLTLQPTIRTVRVTAQRNAIWMALGVRVLLDVR